MKLNFKSGVLIIGSLLWDDHQGNHRNLRKHWRQKRLSVDKKIHVKVPIRYGRLSGDNQKNYTMVFSKEAERSNQLGTAYVIPFKNKLVYFRSLHNQAGFLSEAEGKSNKKLVKGGEDKWCVIGLLFNQQIAVNTKDYVLKLWQEKLSSHGLGDNYTNLKIGREESILSNRGEILINWPQPVDAKFEKEMNSYDVIIATCTVQNLDAYPTPSMMSANAKIDGRKYFYNNIKNGITTFQDNQILQA
jgi:hypothetical protein